MSCSPLHRAPRAAGLALAAAALAAPAAAQSSAVPLGPDFVVTAGAGNGNQIWPKCAVDPTGAFAFYAWTSGQDVWCRGWNLDGTPRTNMFVANPALNVFTQDEPAIAIDDNGHVLVAWSDRNGYDGELMGIYARVFDDQGAPLTNEVQVNVEWQASQWRPLLSPIPGGGWVVGWTGQWDGENFMRLMDTNGAFLTGDIQVNTFENGAQVDCAPAVGPDGSIFCAFVDYSGFGGVGTGTNIWGRTFDPDGTPRQAMEFAVSQGTGNGDQREPRVTAVGPDHFLVVWEDDTNDGDNWGVFARRYDAQGAPLGTVFRVNTVVTGPQRKPFAASDAAGNHVVVWEDNSAGWEIFAQRYDPTGAAVGAPFRVNSGISGAQRLPHVATDAGGTRLAFSWEGPGNQTDAFSRFFLLAPDPVTYCQGKLNSLGCVPFLTTTGLPSASDTTPFQVRANDVLAGEAAFVIYGFSGRSNLNFHGGKLCVKSPFRRWLPVKVLQANGTPPCDGQLTKNFNARIQSGVDALLTAGARVNAQAFYRDPGVDAFGDGLSDGVEFVILP